MLDGRTSFSLNVEMPPAPSAFSSLWMIGGSPLNPGVSGTAPVGSWNALRSSTLMQSPALARSTSGSTGTPGLRPTGLPLTFSGSAEKSQTTSS